MPGFDAKKYGWSETFHQKGALPTLPTELTKAWWEKQKQITTFLTKSTGIRAELEALAKDFDKVIDGWPRLTSNATRLAATLEDIDKFTTGKQLAAFRNRLIKLEKLASLQSKELGKSSSHSKSAAALKEMAEVAEALKVAVNPSSLGEQKTRALEVWRLAQGPQLRVVVQGGVVSVEGVLAKRANALKTLREEIDTLESALSGEQSTQQAEKNRELEGRIAYAIYTFFRDTTTGIGNLGKAELAGLELENYDAQAGKSLHKVMSKIAELPDASFAIGVGVEKQREFVKQLEKHWNTLARIAKGVRLV